MGIHGYTYINFKFSIHGYIYLNFKFWVYTGPAKGINKKMEENKTMVMDPNVVNQRSARLELLTLLRPGDIIYTVRVNKKENRDIKNGIMCFTVIHDRVVPLTNLLNDLFYDNDLYMTGSSKIIVHMLGVTLFPDGFMCTGISDGLGKCPSKDHEIYKFRKSSYNRGTIHGGGGTAFTNVPL